MLSRKLRRFAAGVVAVAFVACQGSAYVHAGFLISPEPGAAQDSCHEPAQQDSKTTNRDDCTSNCQSQHSPSPEVFKSVRDVTDLPAIEIRLVAAHSRSGLSPPVEPPRLASEPCSYPILHCRLRN